MPIIRSSADLRNNYNDISNYCHQTPETVFITKNGKGDLAVMSIETYDRLKARLELYEALARGLNEAQNGETRDAEDVMAELRARRQR